LTRFTRRTVVAGAASVAAVAFVGAGSLIGQARPPRVTALVYSVAAGLPATEAWVWRARLDGTGAVRIADGYAPRLSPDGRWIVFLRRTRFPRTFVVEIRLVRAAGGDARTIRRYEAYDVFGVEWFRDSSRLLVHEEAGKAVMRRDGTGREIVLPREAESVTIAPDGRRFAYSLSDTSGSDVYVTHSGGSPRRITHDDRSRAPVWGPRGIAYSRGRNADVWLMRPDGRGATRLTRTASGLYPAGWSADGDRLLAHNPAFHNGRLWAVDLRSGRVRRLRAGSATCFLKR
jgi:dipeptidyl aminopeptidase/acylaminoacyl peptidase